MANQSKSLDSILPDSMKGPMSRYIKDLFNVPLTIHGVRFSKDDRGDKAAFTCSEIGKEAKFLVYTRAVQPIQVGAYLHKNSLYPVDAKFIPEGQSVLLVDPSKEMSQSQSDYTPEF